MWNLKWNVKIKFYVIEITLHNLVSKYVLTDTYVDNKYNTIKRVKLNTKVLYYFVISILINEKLINKGQCMIMHYAWFNDNNLITHYT